MEGVRALPGAAGLHHLGGAFEGQRPAYAHVFTFSNGDFVSGLCHIFHIIPLHDILQMSISVGSIDRQSQRGPCHVCPQLEHYQRQNLSCGVDLVLHSGPGLYGLASQLCGSVDGTTAPKIMVEVIVTKNDNSIAAGLQGQGKARLGAQTLLFYHGQRPKARQNNLIGILWDTHTEHVP